MKLSVGPQISIQHIGLLRFVQLGLVESVEFTRLTTEHTELTRHQPWVGAGLVEFQDGFKLLQQIKVIQIN